MSDQDIIDLIAEALYKGHVDGLISFRRESEAVLAALRERYAIVPLDPSLGGDYPHGTPGVSVDRVEWRDPTEEADQ